MEKMFQKNKYCILKRRRLEKYTLRQKITNFLVDNVQGPPTKNHININNLNNRELLILEVDNEKIRFRIAFDNTEYSKSLKEIEKNYLSKEIIDREYLELEIRDNFICSKNPNLISLHQVWEYEYQKKHLLALTGGKIIKQIHVPSMTIDNIYLDVYFIFLLFILIFEYLIITGNPILNVSNRIGAFLALAVVGIICIFMYLNNYIRMKEYERELEYRIEKQRYK